MCTKRLSGNKKDSILQMTKHDLYLVVTDKASSPVDDVHYHTYACLPSFLQFLKKKNCLINDNLLQCLASHQ